MSRVIVKSSRGEREQKERAIEGDYAIREDRKDDFHINPVQLVNESDMDFLRCTVCRKYPSGKPFECKQRGHLVCQDCYTLMDLSQGCVYKDLTDTRCYSSFWNDCPTNTLIALMANLRFRCLHKSCDELIGGGDAWREHLENCFHLNDSLHCPDIVCKESTEAITRSSFASHCEQKHGVNLLNPTMDGRFCFNLDPMKYEAGPGIVFLCQYKDYFLYGVAVNEDLNIVRLATFMVQRDWEWSSRFRVLMETQRTHSDNYVSAVLKVNPTERDWSDIKIFGRSQLLLYPQLDSLCFKDKKTSKKRVYPLEISIRGVAELGKSKGNNGWEAYRKVVSTQEVVTDLKPPKQAVVTECNDDDDDDDEECFENATELTHQADEYEDDEIPPEEVNIDYKKRYPAIKNVRPLRHRKTN